MKPFTSIALLLAALAVILGLSISSARSERRRLLDEFEQTTRQHALASAEVLSARLDALDQDTRLLTDLLESSVEPPAAEPTFRALTVAVPHYRLISLNRPDGSTEIQVVDPTDRPSVVAELASHMQRLAREVSRRGARAIGEPAHVGEHSFLLYGTPVKGGGAVVVASDAAVFLGTGTWPPLPAAHLYVTDPGNVIWAGCETSGGCRATDSRTVRTATPAATSVVRILPEAAQALGLGSAPAVRVSERVDRPIGSWIVTWVASTRAIVEREQRSLLRIVIAAIAAALAVGGIGIVILRQQRRGVVLEGELRYARARASARELENQLVRAEKLITVGVLSTEMAHEVGTPLGVIRGRAEQVLRSVGLGPGAEDLRVIIKHVDNVSSTIRQILDFSRLPASAEREVSLELALDRARELLQWKLEARGLFLDVSLDPGLPPVIADLDQLQQVLVNLLLNACDASEGGGRLRVTAARANGDAVRIAVADSGSGIAPEHIDAVFDPFFTTKKRGQGTGLGLAIVASIVRNHGAQIDLTSTPGRGTTVTLTWPSAVEARKAHG